MALTRKRLIQVKKEATYGTDSTPAGTDALLVRNLEITPIEADVVSRDLIRNYLGASPQLLANTRVSITFPGGAGRFWHGRHRPPLWRHPAGLRLV